MMMNIAANMLGLNNAATPLGLKAMEELNKLNPKLGTATNAMCTFLVINTAGLTLIPATATGVDESCHVPLRRDLPTPESSSGRRFLGPGVRQSPV